MAFRFYWVLLCFLVGSAPSFAQRAPSSPLPSVAVQEGIALPLTSDTHQVRYRQQIPSQGLSRAEIQQRSKQWLLAHCQQENGSLSSNQLPSALTGNGTQEYHLQFQSLAIPYQLHYQVAVHPNGDTYAYTISNFIVELYPDPEHPKSAFFPIEKYLEAVFIPQSNEEQMVAQFKQHVQACANQVATSLKQAMRSPIAPGSPSVTLRR